MKAIGFQKYGPAEVLQVLEVPKPVLNPDAVLIRVAAASVNPADWRLRNGQFKQFMKTPFPFIPGTDVTGIVEAVGEAVTRFSPGDAVYAMLPIAIGGGYAEYAAVAESAVALMPPNLHFLEAAAMPLTAVTALQALRDKAALKPGAKLLIYGASGGVGTFAIQIAKAMGANVTAVCSGRNAELVQRLGADEVRDYTRGDITTDGAKYDVVFDAMNRLSFWKGLRLLRAGGVLVTVNPVLGNLPPLTLLAKLRGRQVKSVFVQARGADLETLNTWIATGQLRAVIDRTYPLTEVAQAHRYSESLRARGKLVLIVNEYLAAERVAMQSFGQASERQPGYHTIRGSVVAR